MASITPELYDIIVKIVDDRVREIKVTREEFDKITTAVNKLAEAQNRTEQRVGQLAEAQQRTEGRLEQLAEAQQRTEGRLEQLAEAQQRTEERLERLEVSMERLAEAQRDTAKALSGLASQVGGLSDTVGFRLEDVARVMVPGWFERHMDITIEGELEPAYVSDGGLEVQVNLLGKGYRPSGEEVIIAGECKSRIHSGEVRSFARALETVKSAYKDKDVVAFMFGYLVHPTADTEAKGYDILVLAPYRR
jgi:multidrug efflux pump subunit AcrA (membrane-fusion protein)